MCYNGQLLILSHFLCICFHHILPPIPLQTSSLPGGWSASCTPACPPTPLSPPPGASSSNTRRSMLQRAQTLTQRPPCSRCCGRRRAPGGGEAHLGGAHLAVVGLAEAPADHWGRATQEEERRQGRGEGSQLMAETVRAGVCL